MYVKTCPAGRPSGVTLRVTLCNARRKMTIETSPEAQNGLSGVFDDAESDFDGFSIQFDVIWIEMKIRGFQAL